MKPWIRKTLWGLGIGTVLFVGVMGFAHTKWGRPLLGYFRGVPGCPAGFDAPVDPVKAEAFRQEHFRKMAGAEVARANPALSFELGKTVRKEVEAWAQTAGASCTEKRSGMVLGCGSLPEGAFPGPRIDDAHIQFDNQGTLVAVDVFRTVTAEAGVAHFLATSKVIEAAVGKPTRTSGEATPAHLAAGPMRMATADWEYKQYEAKLSVMNYGNGRIRVREQYEWVPATSEVTTASR